MNMDDLELGNGDDDDDDVYNSQHQSAPDLPSSSANRSHNLSQQTNQMLSNYQDFLSDMAKEDGLDMSGDSYEEDDNNVNNNDDEFFNHTSSPPQSSSNNNGHTKQYHYSPPKTKEGIAHRSWTRADAYNNSNSATNTDQQHQEEDFDDQSLDFAPVNVNNLNLSTIEEDASLAGSYMTSSRDWPDFMMGYSWDTDDYEHRKKTSYNRLRCTVCQNYKRVSILISIGTILLLAIGLSISGKRKHTAQQQQLQLQQQANDEYAKQFNDLDDNTSSLSSLSYPSDLYNRPPSIEEDDPSNLLLGGEETKNYENGIDNKGQEDDYTVMKNSIETTIHPKWFTTSTTSSSSNNNDASVWTGSNYQDAKTFCKSQSTSSLHYYVCPYDAYCPGGPGLPPYHGIQGIDPAELWAPMYDGQELWVGVGSLNTCLQRGVLQTEEKSEVKYVLCCRDEDRDDAVVDDESEESEDLDEDELLQQEQEDDNQSNMNAKPSNVLELEGHIGQGKDNTASMSNSKQPSASKPSATIQQKQPQKTNADAWTPKTEPPVVQPIPNIHNNNGGGGVQQLTHNEQAALTYMNPLWYGRADGYNGTTHAEAVDFCNSIGDRRLCLAEAYCPNGSPAVGAINPKPLFLRMKAFEGEQWAPISFNANSWVLIGTVDGRTDSTCQLYENIHGGQQPLWGFDGNHVDMKEHILCCLLEKMSEELLAKNQQEEEEGEGRSSSDR